MSMRHK